MELTPKQIFDLETEKKILRNKANKVIKEQIIKRQSKEIYNSLGIDYIHN